MFGLKKKQKKNSYHSSIRMLYFGKPVDEQVTLNINNKKAKSEKDFIVAFIFDFRYNKS